jgi:uncharacterized protein YjbI with pentapeptide repeats
MTSLSISPSNCKNLNSVFLSILELNVYLVRADFGHAQCQRTDFWYTQCQGADFRDAQCQGADFALAQCQGTSFMDTQCQGAYVLSLISACNFLDADSFR